MKRLKEWEKHHTGRRCFLLANNGTPLTCSLSKRGPMQIGKWVIPLLLVTSLAVVGIAQEKGGEDRANPG